MDALKATMVSTGVHNAVIVVTHPDGTEEVRTVVTRNLPLRATAQGAREALVAQGLHIPKENMRYVSLEGVHDAY